MTQLEKAIARLQARPPEARAEDVRRVLAAYGFSEVRQRGSHLTFVHAEGRGFTLPLSHGKTVKRTYVVELLGRLNLGE